MENTPFVINHLPLETFSILELPKTTRVQNCLAFLTSQHEKRYRDNSMRFSRSLGTLLTGHPNTLFNLGEERKNLPCFGDYSVWKAIALLDQHLANPEKEWKIRLANNILLVLPRYDTQRRLMPPVTSDTQIRVPLPEPVHNALNRVAEQLGMTPEEAALEAITAWQYALGTCNQHGCVAILPVDGDTPTAVATNQPAEVFA